MGIYQLFPHTLQLAINDGIFLENLWIVLLQQQVDYLHTSTTALQVLERKQTQPHVNQYHLIQSCKTRWYMFETVGEPKWAAILALSGAKQSSMPQLSPPSHSSL